MEKNDTPSISVCRFKFLIKIKTNLSVNWKILSREMEKTEIDKNIMKNEKNIIEKEKRFKWKTSG